MKINTILFLKKYILWFVIALAVVLRFWGLGLTPPSLYWDEVSQAYNSYSILKTGHDEHKEFMPLARFQAFGDYKAPVYIYLDVLPVLVFGQTEFAVRFPSALLGSLTVLLSYFLVRQLLYDHKKRRSIALLTSFLLAISPWHIQLSRAAYEANVATFFTVLGVVAFLYATRKNIYFFYVSLVSFVIAFYAFNAHRIFIPLLVLVLVCIYFKKLKTHVKKLVPALMLGIFLLIPFLLYFQTPESKLRFAEVNIFSDISVVEESNKLVGEGNGGAIENIIHNRRVLYALSYAKHYLDFYNPTYLFFKGDQNPRFSTQDTGQLFLFSLPFILFGMLSVAKGEKRNKYLLFGWLLISPIAAATARETPHALRSETFIPLFEIFAGIGGVYVLDKLRRFRKITFVLYFIIIFVAVFSLVQFLHAYYVHMPHQYSQDWQYGYKKTIEKTESLKKNYDKIIFSDVYGRAYIYVLWYGGYSPSEYWQKGNPVKDTFGFYNVKSFDKYKFQKPNSYKATSGERVLFVGLSSEIPKDSKTLDKITFLDGKQAFIIAENQQ